MEIKNKDINRFILVASGEDDFTSIYLEACDKKQIINEKDYIIAVDGGLKTLNKLNITPDLFIGDNDSYQNNINFNKLLYKCEKDDSDLELALKYIIENYKEKNSEINIYNATGNRLDHFIANIRMIIKYSNLNIKMFDSINKIYLIKENTIISKSEYKYLSIFNVVENTYVTLKGFKYNTNNLLMNKCCNIGLSNEIITEGEIVTNHPLLVIEAKSKN